MCALSEDQYLNHGIVGDYRIPPFPILILAFESGRSAKRG